MSDAADRSWQDDPRARRAMIGAMYVLAAEGQPCSVTSLAEQIGVSLTRAETAVNELRDANWVEDVGAEVMLTTSGVEACHHLGVMPDQVDELRETQSEVSPIDASEYIPTVFQQGGADWPGSDVDGESPS